MSSTPLTKKDICRLWGVRASYIDAKIEEILTIVERDIDEQYLLTKLNQYGMEIQDVIIDITSVSKSNSPNTNHNNNHNTNNNTKVVSYACVLISVFSGNMRFMNGYWSGR
eukprot:895224_1